MTWRPNPLSHPCPLQVLDQLQDLLEAVGFTRRQPQVPFRRQPKSHRSDESGADAPSIFGSSVLALWINQGTQWFSREPPETRQTRCSLRQLPLMNRLPRSPVSTVVLRINQETDHHFILPFLLPCDLHLTPLATRSLEPSLLEETPTRDRKSRKGKEQVSDPLGKGNGSTHPR
jgi:hypothetical protein